MSSHFWEVQKTGAWLQCPCCSELSNRRLFPSQDDPFLWECGVAQTGAMRCRGMTASEPLEQMLSRTHAQEPGPLPGYQVALKATRSQQHFPWRSPAAGTQPDTAPREGCAGRCLDRRCLSAFPLCPGCYSSLSPGWAGAPQFHHWRGTVGDKGPGFGVSRPGLCPYFPALWPWAGSEPRPE